MPDGQGRALAGGDQQIILPGKQETQRIGPGQTGDGFGSSLARRHPGGQVILRQQCHGFGVGVGGIADAVIRQKRPQVSEIFDDPVMHDGHIARQMRMGVAHRGCPMRGPAGVPDARLARQRVMHQQVRQVDQLAHSPPAVQHTRIHGRNPGAVIAAVFQPLQRLNQ